MAQVVVKARRTLVCSASPGGEGRRGSRRVSRQVELTAQSLWSEVAGRLKGALNDTTYRTWFADAEGIELTDDTLAISVPNDFTREWIEGHFLGLIGAAARDATGQERRIRLTVADHPREATAASTAPPRKQNESGLNSKYTFDSFVIGSSDRPPREISTLEERLRSRFEWGLITDIQPPDLETRIAILRKKVAADGIEVEEPQVLTFVAGRVSTNIRELEGALTRVVAFSSLTGRPMTVELAQDVLRDVFPQGEAAEVSIKRIQELVSERFSLSLEELTSHSRSQTS